MTRMRYGLLGNTGLRVSELFLGARSLMLVVRRESLVDTMSRYLLDRLEAHPRIRILTSTEVVAVGGDDRLRWIRLRHGRAEQTHHDCTGLYCFIGAEATTASLRAEVQVDNSGFILTDRDLRIDDLPEPGRQPMPFESSVPGVFAVGDVRHGSIKRVAAAVGEGASVIRSAHEYLGSTG